MSVKDILVAAFEKDASSFETAFSSVMKEKVSAAVENRFFAAEEYELDESKYEDEEDEDDEDDEDELDEKNFKDKHVVAKYKTPYDTESQFTSTATKAKRKADYNSKEDEQVYEAAELHTKRADKEAVIVRAVDPNTGQSKARVVKRGTGEIKIGEAMDPVGKHDADIDNDGDTDKSDKYLIARRKAIGKAMRKEEVEELDEISKDTADRYYRKAATDIGNRTTSAIAAKNDAYNSKFDSRPQSKQKDEIKARIKNTDRKIKNRAIGMSRASARMEEVEQIDEVSKKTLGSYVKKSAGELGFKSLPDSHKKVLDPKGDLDKKMNLRKTINRTLGIQKAAEKLTKEDLDEAESGGKFDLLKRAKSKIDKRTDKIHTFDVKNKKDYIKASLGKHPKPNLPEEVDQIDEAFKIGAMKLKDGSTVTLTRESVDAFNKLFNQLNSTNKAKMEERMMSSKSGFQEILSFAENI